MKEGRIRPSLDAQRDGRWDGRGASMKEGRIRPSLPEATLDDLRDMSPQ